MRGDFRGDNGMEESMGWMYDMNNDLDVELNMDGDTLDRDMIIHLMHLRSGQEGYLDGFGYI